jgi:MFS family permease
MRDLIPDSILGIFFSRRLAVSFALGSVLSLLACFFLDSWNSKGSPVLYGYSLIFIAGSLIGLIGLVFLAATPEPMMKRQFEIPLKSLFTECFHDQNFNNLLVFLCLWSFAINLAAPFFTVYLIKRLSLDITTIIILSLLSRVCSIFSFPLWGRLTDHYSNRTVLQIAGPLFIICILAFTFTNFPEPHLMTMPLLVIIHIVMGFSTAGVTLSSGNIGLKLAPKGSATAYLGTIGIFTSLAAGISPIIGGLFVDHLAEFSLAWNLEWRSPGLHYIVPTLQLQHWDFFFVVAALVGLFSIHRLSYVKELGEVDESISIPFLVAFGRDLRNFSTAGGSRSLLRFPYSDFRLGRRHTGRKHERSL